MGQIKKLLTREQFALFVVRVYQDFDESYHSWLDELDKAFEQ